MKKLSKKDIKELTDRGIVPGARVRSAFLSYEFIVLPWDAYGKPDEEHIHSNRPEKVTDPNGDVYQNFHWLKDGTKYAAVLEPAPSSKPARKGTTTMTMAKKAAKKTGRKPTKVPDGISYKKTSTGINVTIAENGRILATMRGYNNTANMQKGLRALRNRLDGSWNTTSFSDHRFVTHDLTPKKAKKK